MAITASAAWYLARQTDQAPQPDGNGIIIPLLGLAGEVGSLLTEYKKHLREGPAHQLFKDRLAETSATCCGTSRT